jgi:hypothetical protein
MPALVALGRLVPPDSCIAAKSMITRSPHRRGRAGSVGWQYRRPWQSLADWVRPHPDFRSSLKADLTAHGDPGGGFKSLGDHGRNRAVDRRAYPQNSKTFFHTTLLGTTDPSCCAAAVPRDHRALCGPISSMLAIFEDCAASPLRPRKCRDFMLSPALAPGPRQQN